MANQPSDQPAGAPEVPGGVRIAQQGEKVVIEFRIEDLLSRMLANQLSQARAYCSCKSCAGCGDR